MTDVVNVGGGYWTGSSAVVDLLNEHRDFKIVPGEFTLFSYGQIFPDYIVPRFKNEKTDHYGNSCLSRFRRFNSKDYGKIYSAARLLCRKVLGIYPEFLFSDRVPQQLQGNKDYQTSCARLFDLLSSDEITDRESASKEFIECLASVFETISLCNVRINNKRMSKSIVLDQFIAPTYVEQYCQFDEKTKHVFVDRDWKDQFYYLYDNILQMNFRNSRISLRPFGESRSESSDIVEIFCSIRHRMINARNSLANNSNTLFLDFESLVENRDYEAHRIFNFLGSEADGWTKEK